MLNFIGEFFRRDEVIVHAIFFVAARLAGGGRNGEAKPVRPGFQQMPRDARFAGAGRGGDDDDLLLRVDGQNGLVLKMANGPLS